MNLKTKVAGYYKLQVIRPDGTVRESGEFPNLITDIGLDRMGVGSYLTYCQVGAGSTAPTVTDTSLASFLAASNTKQSTSSGSTSSAPYYTWALNMWRFSAGTATGNISEVGVGWASGGSLFSRALVLDSGGSPTTITVLADEVLDVTYELRYYPPTVDDTGDVTFTGNLAGTYDWIFRAANVTSNSVSDGWNITSGGTDMGYQPPSSVRALNTDIQAITSNPVGGSGLSSTVGSYTNGTYYRDITATATTATGNLAGGIRTVVFKIGVGRFQVQFDPAIPKTASDTLSITFRHSWGRV